MAPTFFVTGATGHQGGAVTRYLISKHVTVHALIRDPSSPSARLLKKLGVVIFPGDFDDITAITTACEGITGVFLNTTFFPSLPSLELMQAKNIISAASAAGAKTIVYSSMLLVGKLESFPPWPPDSSLEAFYESKWEIEESVRRSGIRYWTVLRPAFLMQNFLPPVSRSFFPELAADKTLCTAMEANTPLLLLDAEDVGRFTTSILLSPKRFHKMEIDLGNQFLTGGEVVREMSRISGADIRLRFREDDEVEQLSATGEVPMVGHEILWNKMEGEIKATSEAERQFAGVPKMGEFRDFLGRNVRGVQASLSA